MIPCCHWLRTWHRGDTLYRLFSRHLRQITVDTHHKIITPKTMQVYHKVRFDQKSLSILMSTKDMDHETTCAYLTTCWPDRFRIHIYSSLTESVIERIDYKTWRENHA